MQFPAWYTAMCELLKVGFHFIGIVNIDYIKISTIIYLCVCICTYLCTYVYIFDLHACVYVKRYIHIPAENSADLKFCLIKENTQNLVKSPYFIGNKSGPLLS